MAPWRDITGEFSAWIVVSIMASDCFELVTDRSGDAESPRLETLPGCHLLVSHGLQRRVVGLASSTIQARAFGLTRFADSVCRVGETKSHLAPKLSAECRSRPAALTPGSPGSPSTAPHAPLFTTTTSNASVDAFINKLKESRSSLDTTSKNNPEHSVGFPALSGRCRPPWASPKASSSHSIGLPCHLRRHLVLPELKGMSHTHLSAAL
jgi:hypothetical protein